MSGLQVTSAKGGVELAWLSSLDPEEPGNCSCQGATSASAQLPPPTVPPGGKGSLPGGATCLMAGEGWRRGGEGKRIPGEVWLVKAIVASNRLGWGMHPHVRQLTCGDGPLCSGAAWGWGAGLGNALHIPSPPQLESDDPGGRNRGVLSPTGPYRSPSLWP